MWRRVVDEVRSVAWATLYFAACFAVILLLKRLWLAEHGIEFRGLPTAIFAALVTAKVVLVLERVPLARWLRGSPGIVELATRSAVYTAAVLVVLVLEKGFETRAEHGGLAPAIAILLGHSEMPRVLATAVAVGLAFLAYNAFAVVRRSVGDARLREMFLSSHAKAARAGVSDERAAAVNELKGVGKP
jgi:hypothetical protein